MRAKSLGIVLLAALPLVSGCTSFNRQWKTALGQPLPPGDMAGPWEGHWISDENGHNDRLRCLITPGQPGTFNAYFHANYRKVFSFSYTVPLQVQNTGTNFTFSGEADLGKLAGGIYTYAGTSTPTQFQSTYKSKYDHGRFELSRPEKSH